MKKAKRTISGVLAFCMLLTLLHSVAFATPQVGNDVITVEVVETYGWWGPFQTEGAYVQLFSNGQLVTSAFTDSYGLVEFDLVPDYSIVVTLTCGRYYDRVEKCYFKGSFFFHFFIPHVVI